MEKQNNLSIGRYLGQIGNDGITIDQNSSFECNSNVIRVAAIEDSFIYNENRGQGSNGIFIPANVIEYFKVNISDKIKVISGSVNVSSVY